MTKRIKPVLESPAITSLEEADSALAKISAVKRQIALVNLGLAEDIDALKLKAAMEIEPFNAEIEALGRELAKFALKNKAELFVRKKSLELTFGVIGFRQSTRLATVGKATFKQVLEKLQDRELDKYIRTKHEVDKEALKGAPEDLLKTLGCKLKIEDEFYCEPAETETATTPFMTGAESGEAA